MDVIRFWYITFLLLVSCLKCEAAYYSYYYYYYYYSYSGSVSTGAVVGIIIGIIFAKIIIILVCVACVKACQKNSTRVRTISMAPHSSNMTTQFHHQQPGRGYGNNTQHPPPYSTRPSAPSMFPGKGQGHASNPFAVHY